MNLKKPDWMHVHVLQVKDDDVGVRSMPAKEKDAEMQIMLRILGGLFYVGRLYVWNEIAQNLSCGVMPCFCTVRIDPSRWVTPAFA